MTTCSPSPLGSGSPPTRTRHCATGAWRSPSERRDQRHPDARSSAPRSRRGSRARSGPPSRDRLTGRGHPVSAARIGGLSALVDGRFGPVGGRVVALEGVDAAVAAVVVGGGRRRVYAVAVGARRRGGCRPGRSPRPGRAGRRGAAARRAHDAPRRHAPERLSASAASRSASSSRFWASARAICALASASVARASSSRSRRSCSTAFSRISAACVALGLDPTRSGPGHDERDDGGHDDDRHDDPDDVFPWSSPRRARVRCTQALRGGSYPSGPPRQTGRARARRHPSEYG